MDPDETVADPGEIDESTLPEPASPDADGGPEFEYNEPSEYS